MVKPTRRIIHHITCIRIWLYLGSPVGRYLAFHTVTSVGRNKSFQYAQTMLPHFHAVVKIFNTNYDVGTEEESEMNSGIMSSFQIENSESTENREELVVFGK